MRVELCLVTSKFGWWGSILSSIHCLIDMFLTAIKTKTSISQTFACACLLACVCEFRDSSYSFQPPPLQHLAIQHTGKIATSGVYLPPSFSRNRSATLQPACVLCSLWALALGQGRKAVWMPNGHAKMGLSGIEYKNFSIFYSQFGSRRLSVCHILFIFYLYSI